MSKETEKKTAAPSSDSSARATLIMALVSGVGLVFSGLLYHKSVMLGAGIEGGVSCEVGQFDCAPALTSSWSSLLGIPLPVLSGAFYFGVLALMWFMRTADDAKRTTAARYLFFTFAGTTAFSALLAVIAFTQLTSACPFCMVLYAVQLVGLGVSLMFKPDLKDFFANVGDGLKQMVTSAPVQSSVIVFLLSSVLFVFVYNQWVDSASSAHAEEQRKEGEQAAAQLQGDGEFEVDLEGLPRLGPADAPVVIVEFSDFECPFCQRFAETVHEIHEAYPDDVAIYFSHYPLDGACNGSSTMHPTACFAARATLCAQDQGRFWEMHDKLFDYYKSARDSGENHIKLEEDTVLGYAGALGLQPEAFLVCLNSDEANDRVKAQVKLGKGIGVRSTPTWLLNGHKRNGAHPFPYVAPQIDRLLELKGKGAAKKPADSGAEAGDKPAAPAGD